MSAMMPACAELLSAVVPKAVANSMARRQKPQIGASRYAISPHIAHINIEGFFAAVEQAQRPRFQGKPLLVGQRRVISASYEAKLLGISTGMPSNKLEHSAPGLSSSRAITLATPNTPSASLPSSRLSSRRRSRCSARFLFQFFGSALLDCDFPDTLRRVQLEILKQTGLSVSIGAAKQSCRGSSLSLRTP
jgi:DNA polymerase-4